MTDSEKSRIIAKVKALMAKTIDAGCTESEAMTAANLAAELMQKYDLEVKDIEEIKDDSYGARKREFATGSGRRRAYHEVNNILMAIANYFDCKVWLTGMDLIFFGSKDDTDLAHEMVVMMRHAMDNEWNKNKIVLTVMNPKVHGRVLRTSFLAGMARRLNERFRELKIERSAIADKRGTGTSLVVVKNQVVVQKFQQYTIEKNLKLKTTVATRSNNNNSAFERGKAAANNVTINKSIK